MTIFKAKETKPVDTVFRLPVDDSIGVNGILRSEFAKEHASLVYPLVTNTTEEETKAYLDSGIVGPLQAKAEAVTKEKQLDIYNQTIEVSSLEQKTPDEALAELETLREENPFLKAYVSPATIAALKQSDNLVARRAAQGKLANVLIAAEVMNKKMAEASGDSFWTNFDFVDVLASDLPFVSAGNVTRRKELSDRFLQLLDSNEDAAVVQAEMQAIADEAADMGFFTDSNRFYMADFLGLTLDQGKGSELAWQQAMSMLDIAAFAPALMDAGKLIALTRGSTKETAEALMKGVTKDALDAAVDPSTWKESIVTTERIGPRNPIESAAVKEVESELRGRANAIRNALASGSSIDDDLFEVFAQKEIAAAKDRAKKAGQLRYVDAQVTKDALDNITMTEYFGTSKGKPFTSKIAAQKYAEQVYGEVVPVAGDTNKYLVVKTKNLPTGTYSQGATPDDIIKDLDLYRSLDEDQLGNGFWAHIGSPLSQTDWTNNAILKQGEAARAKALTVIEKDVEATLKKVGKEGKIAVEKVFMEMRDGSLAHLRTAPTVAEFEGYFFKINGRKATEDELTLYAQKLDWADTDWFISADMHFKREVDRGVEMIVPQTDLELPAIRVSRDSLQGRSVWDADAGKFTPIESLPEDRIVYKLVNPTEFDGKLHDLVASATMKTRALKHTDVMGYNVGGSRMYAHNQSNFFIKQETSYELADGASRKGMPRTIMAVKTEKEARKAQDEINSVLSEFHAMANPKVFDKEAYVRWVASKEKDTRLNELIARNSGWNTDVHSVRTLAEFAEEHGLDLRHKVQFVSDGQPLVNGDDMIGDITFKDMALAPGPLKFGDFRKDDVLIGYGGRKLPTIPPFESIQRSVMSSVARQTEVAYEARAVKRLLKTALEQNLLSRENIAAIRNMSVRQKARNMVIDTGTEFGKKLELERKKILARLEKQRILDDAYHKGKNRLANILWDKGWKEAANKIDALSADPVAGTRGIVFDAFLGLGAPDQLFVQASQITNVIAMADKELGLRAAVAMPYFRATFNNGHDAVIGRMGHLMAGILGVKPEDFTAMMTTFRESGRGAVAASLADLGEDGAGKMFMNKIREVGRIPYNEGELSARVTAHIASSLQYLKKYGPKADLLSQEARRYVMHESDKMTQAMTSTSRHAIEQFPMMQFMSYSMRMAEFLTSGLLGGKGVLPAKKKAKLFTMQLALYGASAVPFAGAYLSWYNFKHGTNLTEDQYQLFRKGLLDAFIKYTTGVESELGQRLAWGEGLFNTIQDLQSNSLAEIALGPSYVFGKSIYDSTAKMLWNMKVGGTSFLKEDFLDILRSLKSFNLAYNGYYALRWGLYRTKKGDIISDEIGGAEAAAIAMGIPIEEVNKAWANIENIKKDKKLYMDAATRINGLWNDLYDIRLRFGHGTNQERKIMSALEVAYAMFTPYEIQQIERYVDKKFITMNEELMVEIMKRDALKEGGK